MGRIFISHVEEDQNIALEIARGLEAAGYETWYYERHSVPGVSYLIQTGKAIEDSQAIVLLISPHSLGSHQVSKEVDRAHETGKFFIPVLSAVTHAEFQQRQPAWRQAVGSAASIAVPPEGAARIVPRILAGLQVLGLRPGEPGPTPEERRAPLGPPPPHPPPATITGRPGGRAEPERPARWRPWVLLAVAAPALASALFLAREWLPWGLRTYRYDRTLTDHTSPVNSVVFSQDGHLLASGSGRVSVQETSNWQQTRRFSLAQFGDIEGMAFSPDGAQLALVTDTGHAEVRQLASDSRLLIVPEGMATWGVAFSPDGRSLATGHTDRVRIWQVATGQVARVLRGRTVCTAVAFSPDGRWIASGGADNGLRLWETATGKDFPALWGHTGIVTDVAFSPDGRWLASSSYDDTVKLWEVATRREIRTLRRPSEQASLLNLGLLASNAFAQAMQDRCTSVSFSPDGRLLACSHTDGQIHIWKAATARHLHSLSGHEGPVWALAFSADGRWLASGGQDTTVKLWRRVGF